MGKPGDLKKELRWGSSRGEREPTIYLCEKNHRFVVWGPHVWAQLYCPKKRSQWQVVKLVKTGFGRKSEQRVRQLWIVCGCGAATKKRSQLNKDVLRAVEAAGLIGGMEAALQVLNVEPGYGAARHLEQPSDWWYEPAWQLTFPASNRAVPW